MKNKVLFIVNSCVPFKGPNATCLRAIADELKSSIEVHILTIGDHRGHYIGGGLQVFSAAKECDPVNSFGHWLGKRMDRTVIYSGIMLMTRLLFTTFTYMIWPDFTVLNVKAMREMAIELIRKYNYRAIITVSGSFTPQLVGLRLKEEFPHLRWIAHFNDPLPCNNFLYSGKWNLLFDPENVSSQVLHVADRIALSRSLYEYYSSTVDEKCRSKLAVVDIPLIFDFGRQEDGDCPYKKIKGRIDVVYAGAINRRVRNPSYMLELFARASRLSDMMLHIFGENNCAALFAKYRYNDRIKVYGSVPLASARAAVRNADVLLNIGNKVGHQVPSKIFEYMSCGKPIISLYNLDNDSSIPYLEKYPCSLQIREEQDKLAVNVERFAAFCVENAGKTIEFQRVRELFMENTPAFCADTMLRLIDSAD